MTSLSKALLGAAMGAGILAFSAVSASAAVVCNGNVCWHAKERHTYPPDAHVTIHEDTWKAGPSITFREHEGLRAEPVGVRAEVSLEDRFEDRVLGR
jgi:hypothetical protein